jgi:hypothetical protein
MSANVPATYRKSFWLSRASELSGRGGGGGGTGGPDMPSGDGAADTAP